MDISLRAWLLIAVAFIFANLPFYNERLFGCISIFSQRKPFWVRFFELTSLYCIVGIVAYFLEWNVGNVQTQRWEFYAITYCFFLVMAYPGFVMRYLWRSSR